MGEPPAARLASRTAFLELHIEQGPHARAGGRAAWRRHGDRRRRLAARSSFEGEAGHAGTTPMDGRADALVAAAEFVLRSASVAAAGRGRGCDGRRVEVEPGAANVIPARVVG